MPVTVTVAEPRVAVLEAVRVSALVVVAEVGLNAAVTPPGKPLAANATLPENPPLRVIVMVLVPVAPRAIDRLDGFAESEKSGVAARLTVRAMVAVCESVPDVPLTVTVADPTVAVPDAVRVSVLVVVADAGLNVAVTPAGNPLAVRDTAPEKPFAGAMVMVVVALAPCVTETVAGAADNVKSGGADPAISPTMIPRPLVQK